jgi:curli biogenesis system outer membrane secretion channel CsgG
VWRIATLLAALAALALLGAGAALWRAGRIWLPRGDDRRTVAVMFFENRSGNPDLDWLREGLADMLVTGLARSSRLTLLGRDQLSPLRRRKGVRESDTIRGRRRARCIHGSADGCPAGRPTLRSALGTPGRR